MTPRQNLDPVLLNGIESHPSGGALYLARDAATARNLGGIRVWDNRRFGATNPTGGFVGVPKTLAEAMDSLASLDGATKPSRGLTGSREGNADTRAAPSGPGPGGRHGRLMPGALHALIRRKAPVMKAGDGARYGLGFSVINDEMIALSPGLASGPRGYPWQAHAKGMVAHMVRGVVAEKLLRFSLTVSADRYPAAAVPPGRRGR